MMAAIFVGGAIAPQVTFDGPHLLEQLSMHQVNEIMAVPAVTLPLIAELRRRPYDVSSISTVFASGGMAPPPIWDGIHEVFGDVEIYTGYGMTETTASTTCTLAEHSVPWIVPSDSVTGTPAWARIFSVAARSRISAS